MLSKIKNKLIILQKNTIVKNKSQNFSSKSFINIEFIKKSLSNKNLVKNMDKDTLNQMLNDKELLKQFEMHYINENLSDNKDIYTLIGEVKLSNKSLYKTGLRIKETNAKYGLTTEIYDIGNKEMYFYLEKVFYGAGFRDCLYKVLQQAINSSQIRNITKLQNIDIKSYLQIECHTSLKNENKWYFGFILDSKKLTYQIIKTKILPSLQNMLNENLITNETIEKMSNYSFIETILDEIPFLIKDKTEQEKRTYIFTSLFYDFYALVFDPLIDSIQKELNETLLSESNCLPLIDNSKFLQKWTL